MATLEKTVLIRGRSIEDVFSYCVDGTNFPKIFPEPIRPVGKVNPYNLRIEAGREFEFIHWMMYCVPCKWRVRIVEVIPNERFIDQMVSGPLRRFRHEHIVQNGIGGTLYTDRVEYEPYCGRLAELLIVNAYMERIFVARHRNMRNLLELP